MLRVAQPVPVWGRFGHVGQPIDIGCLFGRDERLRAGDALLVVKFEGATRFVDLERLVERDSGHRRKDQGRRIDLDRMLDWVVQLRSGCCE